MTEQTLVLLGDSILDNAPYTRSEPDTTAHLSRLLSPDWSIRRLAWDGATMPDIPPQLARVEGRPAAAVLSIGGNDVLHHIEILERDSAGASEVLDDLLAIAEEFDQRYELVARAIAERAERTILCTIYEVRLEPEQYGRLARVPLAILNDRIIRTAARLGVDVLELRSVCTEASDFVMQIEPSARGALKIAEAITAVLRGDEMMSRGAVYSG